MKKIPVRHIAEKEQAAVEKFNIRDVKELLGGKDLFHELHRHDFFFMLVLQKGKGTHEIDFINHAVSDNAVFFIRPGQVHQLMLRKDCTGYLLEFSAAFYQPVTQPAIHRFRKAGNKNFCKTDRSRFKKLLSVLAYVFEEYKEKKEGYQDAIKANLDIFFIELVRQSKHPKIISNTVNSYAQERLEEFSALLELHITTHKQVAQYTQLMNLSPYQLNEITKATIGKTSSALINEHIILEAKRYLLATPNQIKDIADQLGYEDVSYFIRFFKKHTGYSPEAFRNKYV
ncbi:AraC family transcriptional regulator [Ferruginibacter sp. SUN106]|uniref:AraC family transcriptional regulator n=1 Tax=Ferruginibacter sp. SUN106 TaxID=2978348 RepID=UPI003D36EAE3